MTFFHVVCSPLGGGKDERGALSIYTARLVSPIFLQQEYINNLKKKDHSKMIDADLKKLILTFDLIYFLVRLDWPFRWKLKSEIYLKSNWLGNHKLNYTSIT